jgi:hypothetical protein
MHTKEKTAMNTQTPSFAKDRMTHTTFRQTLWSLVPALLAAVLLTGCASTKVSNQRLVYDKLPKPSTIFIYDFASTPAEIPAESALATQGAAPTAPPTAEQVMIGRQLGTDITTQLIDAVRGMGLNAVRGVPRQNMQVNDIVIRGYLVSVEQGSTAKRLTIGFGSGGSELSTVVEGYQVTAQGLRKIGSATLDAKGNKTPGAAVGGATWLATGSPVGLIVSGGMKLYGEASGSATVEGRAKQTAKEIAERMKLRFQEEGWISQ